MSSYPLEMVLAGIMLLFKLVQNPALMRAFMFYDATTQPIVGRLPVPFVDLILPSLRDQYLVMIDECLKHYGLQKNADSAVAMVARHLIDRTPFEIHNYPSEFVLITQGSYEDYQVVGLVRGATHKEIETAYAEFKDRFYAQWSANTPKGYGERYYYHMKAAAKTMGIESETGSFYDKMGEYFINWLVKYKHLSVVDVPLFQVTES